MYDRILIHVDRRESFEASLPFVEDVLQRGVAKEAVLSTVVKPCEPVIFGYVFEPEDTARVDAQNVAAAEEHLRRIARQFEHDGVPIRTKVLVGDPTDAFRDYAAQGEFDLVVIAPTGRKYLLERKPRAFRRALRLLGRPVMVLQALTPPPRTPAASG